MPAAEITTHPLQLPSYESVNSPPPNYSIDPICGEQSIQSTPRTRARPTGTFIHKTSGNTTVVLMDQQEGVVVPEYGRQGIVNGLISFASREPVHEVKLKLHGHMDLVICGNISQNTNLVDFSYTLWKIDLGALATSVCPSELPFTCIFPSTYKDRLGREVPLPPSIHASYPGSTGLTASCVYTLTVKVVKSRGRNFFTQIKKITIPLNYRPKFRGPHSSLSPHPDLFSDVKIAPEEWHQSMATVRSRKPALTPPVQCHLFIPSVRIFAFSDPIPFHVQITGQLSSLQQLVYGSKSKYAPKIRVYLLRQLTVDVCGQKGCKNVTLAEGTLSPRPPPITLPPAGREDSLDWEGVLRCDPYDSSSYGISGFIAGDLTVKDFMVLSISPPNPLKSDLLPAQVSVTIKLVTESAEVRVD
ncbi:hypothetical protein D9757_007056 [Collybiopsis confluens]|uniref:Uncharacterized protein n=1 Tax=Collybiopsis confluens TaxID=2823264 RepID=A0A8H5HCH6_9AGAR|nr:hypothetical protein D9757_007056 [Collybiopsis confluens]